MSCVFVSVPGKTIVSGEHAVLYGCPVVSLAIDQRLEVKIKTTTAQTFFINSKQFGDITFNINNEKQPDNWCKSIYFLCKKLSACGLEINIDSKILNWGFGTSGATFAGVCCGLLLLKDAKLSKTELLKQTLLLYFEFQKLQHQITSGTDVITSILGGVVYYNKSKSLLSQLNVEFFKNMQIHAIYTGHKTSTNTTVEVVKTVNGYQDVLNKIGKITDKISLAILHSNKNSFYNLIKENQLQLQKLKLVDTDTKNILDTCKRQNIVAKISGSGLGDCVIAFGGNVGKSKYKYISIKPDEQGLCFDVID